MSIEMGWLRHPAATLLVLVCGALMRGAEAREMVLAMPGPGNMSQVQFVDPLHGVAMGQPARQARPMPGDMPNSSPIVWTDDGGENWNTAHVDCAAADIHPESLWLLNAQLGWALMLTGGKPVGQVLLKTEDGGKNWTRQPAPEIEKKANFGQIWFDRQGKQGWINTRSGPLLKTTDSAKTWQSVTIFPWQGGPLLANGKPLSANFGHDGMHVFSFEHLSLCGYAGAILETSDAGRTWHAQQIPLEPTAENQMNASLRAIHFTPGGRAGWAIGGEGDVIHHPNGWGQMRHAVVVHTVDAGKTWQRSHVELRAPLNDVWAISDREAWICGIGGYALQGGAPGTLRHTVDGGKTWINEHPGISALRKLFFLDAQHGWAAGGIAGGTEPESMMIMIRP